MSSTKKAGKKEMIRAWLFFMVFLFTPIAHAKTLVVGKEYSTIIEALSDASPGDTIEVRGGRYKGNIVINKSIFLRGISNPEIIADRGVVVDIRASNVLVEGFTITFSEPERLNLTDQDSGIYVRKGADSVKIRNNRILNTLFGVYNFEGKDLEIRGNRITGIPYFEIEKRGNCINLTGSKRAKIIKNQLSDCRDGVYMELSHDAILEGNEIKNSRYAVHTMWVDRITCRNNTAHDNLVGLAIMYTDFGRIERNLTYGNRTHGLLFIQAVKSVIRDNITIANTKGMFLYNSVYNKIIHNLIMNNQLGIHNWGGSEDNEISNNTIINNEIQVKFVAARNQFWDNNYWSDYLGWDLTGDRVGDLPYESNSVVDYLFWRYPMAKLLFASPAMQVLWIMEKQFPLIRVPRVVDRSPAMQPFHPEWKELMAKFAAYKPERIYGEIKKLPHLPGGSF